jgi:dethiobiotin synthase
VIPGVFVTGTDTGVGKSRIVAGLVRRLRAAGVDAVPMKPVQTGAVRDGAGRLVAPDLEEALAAAALDPGEREREELAPYRFEPACSPHLAARLAERPIDLETIAACAARVAARRGAVVVEGAGGVLVPLGPTTTMLDLAATLRLPVVVVARAGLGTLNHVLLTVDALRRRALDVAGVVLNDAEPADEASRWIRDDNARALEERGVPILARIPFCLEPTALDAALGNLDVVSLVRRGRRGEP